MSKQILAATHHQQAGVMASTVRDAIVGVRESQQTPQQADNVLGEAHRRANEIVTDTTDLISSPTGGSDYHARWTETANLVRQIVQDIDRARAAL
jgi:hypothetical protein